MTTVDARCPTCGKVRVPLGFVRVWTTVGNGGLLAFPCPACAELALLHISARSLEDLAALGVPMAPVGEAPTRATASFHPEPAVAARPETAGDAFTEDDVIAFGLLLNEDDWFDRLVGSDGTSTLSSPKPIDRPPRPGS